MGYVTTATPQIIIPVGTHPNITLTATPTDINLFHLHIPVGILSKNILSAWVEFRFNRLKNTNAAVNFCANGNIEISNDGGTTYHTAVTMMNLLGVDGTGTTTFCRTGLQTIEGDLDIASYVTDCIAAAVDVYFQWTQASSDVDTLVIDDYDIILHLIVA